MRTVRLRLNILNKPHQSIQGTLIFVALEVAGAKPSEETVCAYLLGNISYQSNQRFLDKVVPSQFFEDFRTILEEYMSECYQRPYLQAPLSPKQSNQVESGRPEPYTRPDTT
jgi:hypothetical protein